MPVGFWFVEKCITKIFAKTKAEAEKVLGTPAEFGALDKGTYRLYGTETRVKADKGIYNKGDLNIEVGYLVGSAQLITITPPEGKYSFADDSQKILEKVGLVYNSPSFENEITKRWENVLSGLYSVSIFGQDDKVTYMYIIVDEKYK